MKIESESVTDLFYLFDLSCNGKISFDEFALGVEMFRGEATALELARVRQSCQCIEAEISEIKEFSRRAAKATGYASEVSMMNSIDEAVVGERWSNDGHDLSHPARETAEESTIGELESEKAQTQPTTAAEAL